MMNALTIFPYEGNEVRTLTRDGDPWFAGKDVCAVFGDTNHNRSLSRVHEEDKAAFALDTAGGNQSITFVNESGLYDLLFSMQPQRANHKGVPNAYPPGVQRRIEQLAAFRRWVTHEVLPAIRKHGLYAADDLLNDPDLFIRALTALKEERAKNTALTEKVGVQDQQIAEMRPKAGYFDVVLACKDAVAISVIAKDYGWSAKRMNRFLYECGIQFKQGKTWLLYQRYAPNGFTVTQTHLRPGKDGEPHSKVHTYWTQKGRLYIYETMKEKGHLPLIERGSAA